MEKGGGKQYGKYQGKEECLTNNATFSENKAHIQEKYQTANLLFLSDQISPTVLVKISAICINPPFLNDPPLLAIPPPFS